MARALIAEYPRTEHGLTGLAQEVELALEADEIMAAQTALATMEAVFPDEVLTEAARAYFVLMAGEDALPARAAATPIFAASSSSASASTNAGGFALLPAYPNPFNPQTQVRYEVMDAANVHLVVFDMLGREIAVLVDGRVDTGLHTASFDGSQLASGIYLLKATVRPETESVVQTYTQRITLIK